MEEELNHFASDGIYSLVVWTSTECWLVFILGTLPSLRALFIRMSGQISAGQQRPNRISQGYHRSGTDHVIAMYPRGKHSDGDVSHGSAECIIPNENEIVKTTNIQVSRVGGEKKDFVTTTISPV